ncbi:hypothetical protein QJS04_geneDACA015859 [Acorus gramineus]|uniref:Uncharacterized protein n=1 Tax=Acorus gramineus TaxID=55184 RepID=A0AAV9BQZ5_ACOGR|nr:hypothetical protein QJS04_geneDACA015859 [Acorus gramineus]
MFSITNAEPPQESPPPPFTSPPPALKGRGRPPKKLQLPPQYQFIQPKLVKSERPIEIFSPPPKRGRGRPPKNPLPSSATPARKTPSSAKESRPTPPSKMVALKAKAMEIRKAAEALSKEADNVRVKITEFEKAAADFGLTRSAAAAAAAGSISGARFSL